MIARLARKRGERMKQDILRGVYEDNLRILGRVSPRQYIRARIPRAAKIAIGGAAFAGVALFTGSSLSPQLFPEQQIQARFVTAAVPPAAAPPATRAAAPAPPPAAAPAPAPAPAPTAAAPGPQRQPSLDPALLRKDRGLPLSRMLGLGVKTILIDPGHGGEDTGAIGRNGTREKELSLDIAKRLKARLERDGLAEVLLTRSTDVTLPLQERVALAQVTHADLFISVHLNFLPQKPINIIETFYFGPSRDAKALDLARRENGAGGPGMSEFRALVERLGETLKLEESRALADAIQSSLYRNSRRTDDAVKDFGTKRAPFFVLLGAEVPAVLAEVSCLSNAEEEARLGTPEHREDIAAFLETGILDYLRNRENTYESKK